MVQGVDIGRSELVLHVRVCEGLMRQLDGTVEKRFAKQEILYPLQVFFPCCLVCLESMHGLLFATGLKIPAYPYVDVPYQDCAQACLM